MVLVWLLEFAITVSDCNYSKCPQVERVPHQRRQLWLPEQFFNSKITGWRGNSIEDLGLSLSRIILPQIALRAFLSCSIKFHVGQRKITIEILISQNVSPTDKTLLLGQMSKHCIAELGQGRSLCCSCLHPIQTLRADFVSMHENNLQLQYIDS